jgi:putative oxidoreductase
MDWKRLAHFALLGSSDLQQYAILLVRVSIGLFFAIAGATNCLSRRHETCFSSRGVFFDPACAARLIDRIVATLTEAISTMPKGLSPLSWLDDFLYLPEVLYVLLFIWLICSAPGRFSVDYWLSGKFTEVIDEAACC